MIDIEKAIEKAEAQGLPFESWERLKGESGSAYSAFCAYRDFGAGRNIRKAIEAAEKKEAPQGKRYRMWLNWSAQFRWRERAEGYDRCIERLKQAEMRKTIEAQGEAHRQITGKMLQVVGKKLDLMDPAELTQSNLTEWAQLAIKAERDAAGLVSSSGKPESKQGELMFSHDFQGL